MTKNLNQNIENRDFVLKSLAKLAPKVVKTFLKVEALYASFKPYELGKRDNANRWYPKHPFAVNYCKGYRTPSRSFPHSYRAAVGTLAFFQAFHTLTKEQMSAYKLISKFLETDSYECQHDRLAALVKLSKSAERLNKLLTPVKSSKKEVK